MSPTTTAAPGIRFDELAAGHTEDVRLRVAFAAADKASVERGLAEVEALYCAGPAAGGGIRVALRPRIAATSCFVPRDALRPRVEIVEAAMPEMRLHALAHARTGDKGDRLNISLTAYAPELFPLLVETVTESAVTALFAHRRPTAVVRYVLPKLWALNFVLDGVLDGGVTQALNLDSHGKTQSYRLLGMSIAVPEELARFARG